MALTPTVLTDVFLLVNSNNISDHGNKIEVDLTVDDNDITAFGQSWHVRTNGLKDGVINITLFNDFVASQLDSIMFPLFGTVVLFEIRPTSAARSTGNPAFFGNLFVNAWKPIVGQIGDTAQVDLSFPTSGAVTRAIS